SGALAKAYLEQTPGCEYIGIEVDADYANAARSSCTRVIVDDIEKMEDRVFGTLFPADCWVFADVLEHLYDPWSVLRRLRGALSADASVVACIPNAQHWSFQAKLNCGMLKYEDDGLFDRTHIRWFTKMTIGELFQSSGFRIVEGTERVFEEPFRDSVLVGIKALAEATGADVQQAVHNAKPLQWVVRATPA
ncbi:MAG TPA: class I SAM-dependent methyltransferase, partial [Burkholderiales bacterium]|nr:class I SAM-dependent methyltransferase [Burkholderiales bacterium]